MTVILECIAEQHRRNCKQAERGQAIHKIRGKSSITEARFTITVLTMKYRRERESLPVRRTVLIRPLSIGYFEFAANSRHRCGLVRGAPADPNAD
jgi:hypothetical protein